MTRLALSAAAYLAAVVTANWLTARYGLVPSGPWGLSVTAGTYAAGAALLARDFCQRYAAQAWGRRPSITFSVLLILTAGALSWVLSTPALAIASTLAFLTAEAVDLAVFTPLRDRAGFLTAAAVSNVVSAPIDTIAFLTLAGFPLTWQAVTGQFLAKVLWVTLLPLIAWWVAAGASRRQLTAA